MHTFVFVSDPGHGWLKVSKKVLTDVGMTPQDFSAYSFRSKAGNVFYLEEDCDASRFIDKYKAKYGYIPHYTYQYVERFNRNMFGIRE